MTRSPVGDTSLTLHGGSSLRPWSAGTDHACALRHDGTIACWGRDDQGQASPPEGTVVVPEGARLVAVSAGDEHVCGLFDDGEVACWTASGQGWSTPFRGERLVALDSGGSHTCGLREDGTAVCRGHFGNDTGQASPPANEKFVSISGGGAHTCALREDGSPSCWGADRSFLGSQPEHRPSDDPAGGNPIDVLGKRRLSHVWPPRGRCADLLGERRVGAGLSSRGCPLRLN